MVEIADRPQSDNIVIIEEMTMQQKADHYMEMYRNILKGMGEERTEWSKGAWKPSWDRKVTPEQFREILQSLSRYSREVWEDFVPEPKEVSSAVRDKHAREAIIEATVREETGLDEITIKKALKEPWTPPVALDPKFESLEPGIDLVKPVAKQEQSYLDRYFAILDLMDNFIVGGNGDGQPSER